MHTIKFTTNWNNKLHCKAFTTIRMRNDSVYHEFARLKVEYEKEGISFEAEVLRVKPFMLDNLTNHDAFLDTGYNKTVTISIIETMYKNKNINVHSTEFVLITLKKL